jgi:hypothetical protein
VEQLLVAQVVAGVLALTQVQVKLADLVAALTAAAAPAVLVSQAKVLLVALVTETHLALEVAALEALELLPPVATLEATAAQVFVPLLVALVGFMLAAAADSATIKQVMVMAVLAAVMAR